MVLRLVLNISGLNLLIRLDPVESSLAEALGTETNGGEPTDASVGALAPTRSAVQSQ